MTEKEKDGAKKAVKKTAKGVRIVVAVAVTLFALVVLGTWIFVGVRLWQWLAPLFANA